MARADRKAEQIGASRMVDLYEIGDLAARDLTARASDRAIDLGFALRHAPVDGHGVLLPGRHGNLVDN